jgi:hypothetical protein
MGRYYQGDIEGKFWFGVQNSDDGEFFGATECTTNIIDYEINCGDIEVVKEGIMLCKKRLRHALLEYDPDAGFKSSFWKYLTGDEQRYYSEWMARLEMGMKILIFFNDSPDNDCYFTAEF